MASSFVVEMHAEQAVERLGLLAEEIPPHIHAWLAECAEMAKVAIEEHAPVGVAGEMGQGLSHNIIVIERANEAFIGPNTAVVPYAEAVEHGSRPHMPPVGPDSALTQWCEMKGLNVWAVAKTMARNGTKPHPFVAPAYDDIKDVIPAHVAQQVGRFIGVDL